MVFPISEIDYSKFKSLSKDNEKIDEAIDLIRKIVMEGQPGANNELADMLIKRGKQEDIEEAIAICREGMMSGNLWSQGRMAKYYRDGIGLEKNLDRAIDLMIEPAEARIKWAVLELESMLIQRNNAGDEEILFRLYLIGALEGDTWSQIKAARCYINGKGTPKDKVLARTLYTVASKNNDVALHELKMLK